MTRIAIIGTHSELNPEAPSAQLIHQLLGKKGEEYDFTIFYSSSKSNKHGQLNERRWNRQKRKSIVFSAGITLSLIKAFFKSDVLMVLDIHCAWLFPLIRLISNKKIITVNAIGIPEEESNVGHVKRVKNWLERIALRYTHLDISDTQIAQDYKAKKHGYLSRIIELGGDHVESIETTYQDHETFPFLKYQYAVSICNVKSASNIRLLLETYKELKSKNLVVTANWEATSYGRKLKQEFSTLPNIFMLDTISDKRTLDLIRGNAMMYIHLSTESEGSNQLIEAMSLGLPVLAYKAIINQVVTEKRAAYFASVEDLKTQIRILNMEKLRYNSICMQEIAERNYRWNEIIHKYSTVIEEVLNSTPKKVPMPSINYTLHHEILLRYNAGHLKHQYAFHEN